MNILLLDQDDYCYALDDYLDEHGGDRLPYFHCAYLPNPVPALLKANPDAIVVDVAHEIPVFKKSLFEICREISRSKWAKSHELTVFTRMPRSGFEERAKTEGIDLSRVGYYSKTDLEIPPVLEGIADELRVDPCLIGAPRKTRIRRSSTDD